MAVVKNRTEAATHRVRARALVERVPARTRQFAGWFALGVVAFGAEVALLGALRQWMHCPLWLASAIAAELVLLGRFVSTDRFVFGHAHPTLARCVRFHAAAIGSFSVSWLVLNGSAVLLDVQYVVAAFLGSVAAFAWSALTNFFWVWRPANREHMRVESDAAYRQDQALFSRKASPLLNAVFRAPVWLYRLRLGWILGHRFLMLTHRGRKSGRIYRTVIEVVHYNPKTRESVVVSAWGNRADWYRNIQHTPPLEVATGSNRYQLPAFRELAPDEYYPLVVDYMRRLPAPTRPIVRRLGFDIKGTDEARRAHAERLLMIAFWPRW